MRRIALFVVGFAIGFVLVSALAGCSNDSGSGGGGGGTSVPPVPPDGVWAFQYSPGMLSPAPNGAGGYAFTFPYLVYRETGVHYLVQGRHAPLTGSTAIVLDYEVTGEATFISSDPASNACPGPAHFQLYIQRAGYQPTAAYQWFAWFHVPRNDLTPGRRRAVAPLTVDQWANVFAQQDATQFAMTLAQPQAVGMTFGKGCFAGHGVYVTGGSVTFTIHSFEVE